MAECFARVETKYMLTLPQAVFIGERLAARGFSRPDFGSPTVQSLYYDTPDYELIRQSLERPVRRVIPDALPPKKDRRNLPRQVSPPKQVKHHDHRRPRQRPGKPRRQKSNHIKPFGLLLIHNS